MLGREHLLLSIETIFPLFIPFVFLGWNNLFVYAIVFYIALMIGALVPDSDCKGKSKLHYDFPFVNLLMKPIKVLTIQFFRSKKIRAKLKIKGEIKEEHRGIMHSPIGILISSFLLTLILLIILIAFKGFNLWIILSVFFGLFLGQFLHLVQDSCTVTGINWNFPFGEKWVQGRISTQNYLDKRPKIYALILGFISIGIILGYAFKEMPKAIVFYPLMIILISLIWILFLKISKRH
jgi:membrane-bound metal-dependent hydrolase YbcI (DUF457 family)